jgi:hypothetical protein
MLSLEEFTKILKNNDSKTIRGIYVTDLFSLRVLQQPIDKKSYVSSIEGTVTQFGMAMNNNIIGILAHNFSSGRHFKKLNIGNIINVIYGDGIINNYKISGIKQYRAENPNNDKSNFIDTDTNKILSANGLFIKMYAGKHHLILQTCIQKDKETSWGRLFVIAYPIEKED